MSVCWHRRDSCMQFGCEWSWTKMSADFHLKIAPVLWIGHPTHSTHKSIAKRQKADLPPPVFDSAEAECDCQPAGCRREAASESTADVRPPTRGPTGASLPVACTRQAGACNWTQRAVVIYRVGQDDVRPARPEPTAPRAYGYPQGGAADRRTAGQRPHRLDATRHDRPDRRQVRTTPTHPSGSSLFPSAFLSLEIFNASKSRTWGMA